MNRNGGPPSPESATIPSDASYTYSLAYSATTGLLDTLTYPIPAGVPSSQLKLQYGYTNGFLTSVADFNSGTAYWTANSANARNQVTQETLGNHVVTNRSFDAVTGWPGSVTSGVNGATDLQNDSYLFDEVGNVIQRENNNPGLTENFYYDGDYRLDHSTLGSTSNVNLQMHYDATGNITSRSDLAGGATWTYDPNRKHAVTQAGNAAFAYTYDQNGNVTSRDGYSVTWTSYNHPSSITSFGESVTFAYKQDHTRWSAVYNGSSGMETTYFIGDLLEKVISAGSVNYRHYIYAGPTKIAIYTPTSSAPQVYYVREDHLGSVSGILNSDGTSYVKESFTAFGARRSSCTWSGPPTAGNLQAIDAVTRHGFTWQAALGAMGLNDMNGRIEDAVTGRFLSPDPLVPDVTNTQDLNRYSYVRNNPLTFIDPSGFDPCGATEGGTSDVICATPAPAFVPGAMPAPLLAPPGFDPSQYLVQNLPIPPPPPKKDQNQNQPQSLSCPTAPPLSKSNMTPVPFTDDSGNPILGPDGSPMQRPAGFDPHFFTGAGANDSARTGPGVFLVNSLVNFRIGGPWDAQRGANGQWYPEFRDFANVAIGLYAGADGLTADQVNMVANFYASTHSQFPGQVMDPLFTHLPQVNVDNTRLGASLATVGGAFGICTPQVQPSSGARP